MTQYEAEMQPTPAEMDEGNATALAALRQQSDEVQQFIAWTEQAQNEVGGKLGALWEEANKREQAAIGMGDNATAQAIALQKGQIEAAWSQIQQMTAVPPQLNEMVRQGVNLATIAEERRQAIAQEHEKLVKAMDDVDLMHPDVAGLFNHVSDTIQEEIETGALEYAFDIVDENVQESGRMLGFDHDAISTLVQLTNDAHHDSISIGDLEHLVDQLNARITAMKTDSYEMGNPDGDGSEFDEDEYTDAA